MLHDEAQKLILEANDLLPDLNSNSVLVMDNVRSHHAKTVKVLLG